VDTSITSNSSNDIKRFFSPTQSIPKTVIVDNTKQIILDCIAGAGHSDSFTENRHNRIMIQKLTKRNLPIGLSRRIVTQSLDAMYFSERKKRSEILTQCSEGIKNEFLTNKCLPSGNETLGRNVHLTQDVWSGQENLSFLGIKIIIYFFN
jgi:hypothetical protein